ncbi:MULTISPECIES: hypothetical protein [Nocardiaceae]|uniref:hypothetical protein n=1 Tax=Nocardiaceae TaxID=85025 RepID=UPI0011A71101|nr:hypothetical protein [Prescottella equi]
MADWGTWVQTIVSGSIGGALTGTIAFFTTKSNQKSAAKSAAQDRTHQSSLKQLEIDAKRDSETLARSVDVVSECVSEVSLIDTKYLTIMDNCITVYDQTFNELDALQPFFNSDHAPDSPAEKITPQERRTLAATSDHLLGQQARAYSRYAELYEEVAPKLAELDLLLTRASLLTPHSVAVKAKAMQETLTTMRSNLQDRIIDEEGRENLDLASLRQEKRELIDAARTWIAGDANPSPTT